MVPVPSTNTVKTVPATAAHARSPTGVFPSTHPAAADVNVKNVYVNRITSAVTPNGTASVSTFVPNADSVEPAVTTFAPPRKTVIPVPATAGIARRMTGVKSPPSPVVQIAHARNASVKWIRSAATTNGIVFASMNAKTIAEDAVNPPVETETVDPEKTVRPARKTVVHVPTPAAMKNVAVTKIAKAAPKTAVSAPMSVATASVVPRKTARVA